MSCLCTASSSRSFIKSFSTLELEPFLACRVLRSPASRSLRGLQQHPFTASTKSAASAVAETNASSASLGTFRSLDTAISNEYALKTGAILDVADLTDETIEELMTETPSFSVSEEPQLEQKSKIRKAKDPRKVNSWESSSAKPFQVTPIQQIKTRRQMERDEERGESITQYISNSQWSSTRKQGQSRTEAYNYSATKIAHQEHEHVTPNRTTSSQENTYVPREREPWQTQKAALQEKLNGEAWNPRKRLSPDAIEGIRALHAQFPDQYHTESLAAQFEVSPEAIRRILKSKWRPNDDEEEDRKQRWFKRGEKVWERYAELGMKPPKRWRIPGVGVDRKHGDVPLWDRRRRGGTAGASHGGGIIVKRGLIAGDVQNEWNSKRKGEDWV